MDEEVGMRPKSQKSCSCSNFSNLDVTRSLLLSGLVILLPSMLTSGQPQVIETPEASRSTSTERLTSCKSKDGNAGPKIDGGVLSLGEKTKSFQENNTTGVFSLSAGGCVAGSGVC